MQNLENLAQNLECMICDRTKISMCVTTRMCDKNTSFNEFVRANDDLNACVLDLVESRAHLFDHINLQQNDIVIFNLYKYFLLETDTIAYIVRRINDTYVLIDAEMREAKCVVLIKDDVENLLLDAMSYCDVY